MDRIKKYFGNIEMTWKKVIVFAIITAFYTALVNELPFLEGTSFQDIAVYVECWVLFALFIILNCHSAKDAAMKCFAFFLISQPLIFLLEVPFEPLGWQIFQYYPKWFIITILTIPGSVIAYQLKKKNWISLVSLSVVLVYCGIQSQEYISSVIYNFPYHLLSAIFCIALAIFLIYLVFDEKKYQRIGLFIFFVVFIAYGVFEKSRFVMKKQVYLDTDRSYTYVIEDDRLIKVEKLEDQLIIHAKRVGNTTILLEDDLGNKKTIYVTVSVGNIMIDEFEEE